MALITKSVSAISSNENYRFTLKITEESTDISTNTSKISWQFTMKPVKNGPGWTSSGTATVSYHITIHNSKFQGKISGYRTGDGEVTLKSGNVTIEHDPDGYKFIGCNFEVLSTSSATALPGHTGYTSMLVTLTQLYRRSTIASAKNITLGKRCEVTWTPKHESFRYRLKFSLGDWEHQTGFISPQTIKTYVYNDYIVPADEQLYRLMPNETEVMSVALTTYDSNNKKVDEPESTKTFIVKIPDDVKPTINSLDITPAELYVRDGPSKQILVKGLNSVNVTSVVTASTGSTIELYEFVGPNSTLPVSQKNEKNNDMEELNAQFAAPRTSGALKYTVKVTDSRGRSSSATNTIECYDYFQPSFIDFNVYRVGSNESTELKDDGTFVYYTYTIKYPYVNDTNKITMFDVIGATDDITHDVLETSVEDDVVIETGYGWIDLGGEETIYKTYKLNAVFNDNYIENITSETQLVPKYSRIVNVRPDGSGIAFGRKAELDGVFDVGYSTRFSGGVEAIRIDGGTNFDTIMTPNIYVGKVNLASQNSDDTWIENYTPCPVLEEATFRLIVSTVGMEQQKKQRLEICNKTNPKVYERFYCGDTWGEWIRVRSYGNSLLWEGAEVMENGKNIPLAEPISKQSAGIVLTFSYHDYANNLTTNYDFHSFFVSKYVVTELSSAGHHFMMSRAGFGYVADKYLRIYDDKIEGTVYNTASGTASGITFNSNYFVLRYVVGV